MEKTRRKIKPIARRRRNFLYFLLAILFAIITGYIFLSFAPDQKIQIQKMGIPILPFFLISFFILLYSILRFIFIYASHAFSFSIIFMAFLIFRIFGLTHWIFTLLFLSLFVSLEYLLAKKK